MWDAEHRKRVGALIDAEIERRGWSPARAAAEFHTTERTIRRARKGEPEIGTDTVVQIAEGLGLPADAILPPRAPEEQSQLDRIEAQLAAIQMALERAGLTVLNDIDILPKLPGSDPAWPMVIEYKGPSVSGDPISAIQELGQGLLAAAEAAEREREEAPTGAGGTGHRRVRRGDVGA